MPLTRRILLQIAMATGLVILVATAVTYRLVYQEAGRQGLSHLGDYVNERARVEEAGFRRIRENLELVRSQFLLRLAGRATVGDQELWNRWFETCQDGAVRSRKEYSDVRKWATLWVRKDADITPESRSEILCATSVCNDLLQSWADSFSTLYFSFPCQANVGFDARMPNWVWDTAADYDDNGLESVASANPKNNPSREIVWNGVVEEPTTGLPYISVMLPVDLDGRNIATIGHDIHALDLLNDSTRSSLPGVSHFIFCEDGRMIAHRERMKDILASNGHLTMRGSGDPALVSLYAAARAGNGRSFSGFDPTSGNYYAIARLAGPEWFFITTMPQAHLRQQAFRSAQWVLWSGLLSLALVLAFFTIILRRQIATPLADLTRATERMSAGDLNARATSTSRDEFGRLAKAFNDMVGKVAARNAELSVLNETLESRVVERTEALRESEERFRKSFEVSPTPSILSRMTDGVFVAANAAFLKASGYTEGEVIGKTRAELNLYAVPKQREEFIEALREHRPLHDKEQLLLTKDGSVRTILVSAVPLELDGQPHILTAGLDITERKQAEVETLKALARERELSGLKTNFVSMVSHEFRTPLGVIQSATDVLDRYLDRLAPDERREHLDMIFRSTRGLAHLVDSALLLGRVEDGRLQFAPTPLDLERLCHEIVDEIHSATTGRCPIEVTTSSELGSARSDIDLLRHILTNLLNNAVKYSEPGVPVRLDVGRSGTDVTITVRDHGIGIPEQDRAHLFTSFARGSNVGHRPGSGLGLLIVKRCVDLHGGSIRIDSIVGKGTTVTVALPVFQPNVHS